MRIKEKKHNLNVIMSLGLNVMFYLIAIFFTLFVLSFDSKALLPRWELWTRLPLVEQGFWPWQKGIVTVVPQGTPGSYWQPGVLIISGILQTVGFMLYKNTQWGKKLKLTLDPIYVTNLKVISKYNYLISDDVFRDRIAAIDLQNKKDAWRLLIQEKLQRFVDRMPRKVQIEINLPKEMHSKRTVKWLIRQEEIRSQLEPTWIDKNIYKLKLRYPKINVKMIVNGYADVTINRMAITDVKLVQVREDRQKFMKAILSFIWVSVFAALSFPAFRQDVWMLIKDFIVYSIALIMNIVMGSMSGEYIHKFRVRETQDRLGYIEGYVGKENFNEINKQVVLEGKKKLKDELESEFSRLSIDKNI